MCKLIGNEQKHPTNKILFVFVPLYIVMYHEYILYSFLSLKLIIKTVISFLRTLLFFLIFNTGTVAGDNKLTHAPVTTVTLDCFCNLHNSTGF